jgi:N-acetylmuramoyl-L-alanine amidase
MHVSDDSHQLFIPFSSAQQPWLPLSTKVANTVVASLVAAENGDENARAESRSARIPVLPSIAAPAVAIEIAPESANIVLNSPQYQQRIARKLADALVAAKLALAQQERTQ